jgi:hypothetical protein
MGWALFTLSLAHASVRAHGISATLVASAAVNALYVAKFFLWYEVPGYVCAADMAVDRFGFMLAWGPVAFMYGAAQPHTHTHRAREAVIERESVCVCTRAPAYTHLPPSPPALVRHRTHPCLTHALSPRSPMLSKALTHTHTLFLCVCVRVCCMAGRLCTICRHCIWSIMLACLG